MINFKILRFITISVIAIATFFGGLNFLKIQYQFYIWEIFIDLKILSLLLIFFALRRKHLYQFSLENLHLKKWEVNKNIFWFSMPFAVYAVVAVFGIVFRQVQVDDVDNASTLVLATIFDIPAIYVFSATSILVEEVFFRVLLFNILKVTYSFWKAATVAAILWSMFSFTDILSMANLGFITIFLASLNFFGVGLLCAALVEKYRSIWVSYSFRIGIISLTSLILPSYFVEADSLLTTKSNLFFSEGFIVSLLIILGAFILHCRNRDI